MSGSIFIGKPINEVTKKDIPENGDLFLIETTEGTRIADWGKTFKEFDDRVSSAEAGYGIPRIATTLNSPPNNPIETKHDVFEAGTYTNWKDATDTPITLTAADVADNDVFFFVKDGVVTNFVKSEKRQADPTKITTWTATTYASGAQVIHDGRHYEANAATLATDVPGASAKWVMKLDGKKTYPPFSLTGYYLTTNGALYGSSYFATKKYYAKEGMQFINPEMGVGNIAQAVFFKQDGTFLSSVQSQSIINAPAETYEVAFSAQNQNTKVLVPDGFWGYQEVVLDHITSKVIRAGESISKLFKLENGASQNVTMGAYLTVGDTLSTNAGFFYSKHIPIRKGTIKIEGLVVVPNAHTILYDRNKVPVARYSHTAATLTIDVPDYVAYFRTTNNNPIKITAVTEINMAESVIDLPKRIQRVSENKIVSIGKSRRFKISFRPKVDLNNGTENLNVISGNAINLTIQKGLTTAEGQHQVYNQKFGAKVSNSSSSLMKNASGSFYSIFAGEELFRLRHTGTFYNLYWEVKNAVLTLYQDATVLKTYDFATYTTVGALVDAILADSDSSAIPAFEAKINAFRGTASAKIGTFEKIPAFRNVTKTAGTVSTCFPTYFHSIDDRWHTFEVLLYDTMWTFALDGIVVPRNLYTGGTTKIDIGGELVFDFTNFDFKDLEITDDLDFSFPIVRSIYTHTPTEPDGINRLIEIDTAFKKRGFQPISYTQLLEFLKFKTPIPKRSYLLTLDDSRHDLYRDVRVREKLIANGMKTNNAVILSFKNDEEIYIKSTDVVMTNVAVGTAFNVSLDSKLTYLGTSTIDNSHIFKLGNPPNFGIYSNAIIINTTYTEGTASVKFPTSPFKSVNPMEVPYSEYSVLIQDQFKILKDFGFEGHIHDLRHEEALDTMTYEEALENARDAVNLYKKRYAMAPTGVVYPYGNITKDHARVWQNVGVPIGYNSVQNPEIVGLTNNTIPYMLNRQNMDSATPAENYFTAQYTGLDYYLP